jgi:hypothetical protein
MSVFRRIDLNPANVTLDASSRVRTSSPRTLGDYKLLNGDRPLFFDTQGTGAGTWANNKYNMTVTSGQWLVRQTKNYHTYFSGNSQFIECTFDNFQSEANTIKRVGYFSSSATSPYDSVFDGFWLENDGTTIRLKASRSGTETLNIPITSWDNYNLISSYNWANFTVVAFDFLWLGGAVLRLFLKTEKGFVLCHTFNYSGTATDVFIISPNQPIRYSIRSTTGTGSFRYICSRVCTEDGGSIEPIINSTAKASSSGITINLVGTELLALAIRKTPTYRDMAVWLNNIDVFISTGGGDALEIYAKLNPTFSSAPTWTSTDITGVEQALGNGTITATGGILLGSRGFITEKTQLPENILSNSFIARLGMTLNNTSDVLALTVVQLAGGLTFNPYIDFSTY